ncbi:DMT family transporter [Cohnella thailandensis]|uniref:DMT family transporter n=1 Tax=Cohnella thailandensis TaxID=557557 RepID=A0A841SZZ4_9BACL|nr:DMT family transporter [Cohnella thailandensis]MBB6636852.1 DMT family transporter [Cohnella thailandensis]MBP1973270.1 drug/metabolite transporter (DMT)-like permease [Cohnella thailandensis]
MSETALSRKQTVFYLAFLILMWGINWPLSKYALEFTPPLLFAGLRTLIGGTLLIVIALPRWRKLRLRETWPYYLLSAILSIVFYYGFQTVGLQYMPAGLFSAIVFLQPVLLGLFAWMWLGERMYTRKMIGLLLGFAGVAAMSIGGLEGGISFIGILLALASALSWALGTVYIKRQAAKVDSLWMTAMQITIGGIVMTGYGSAVENWSEIRWTGSFLYDTLFISVFVIALGWLVYFKLIGSGEASKVGSYTFLIPVVSIVCSVFFLNERLTLNLLAGMALIVVSILLVNARPRRLQESSKA